MTKPRPVQRRGAPRNSKTRFAASFCSTCDVAVTSINDLTALPARIEAAIQDVQAHASSMVQTAERAGQLLLQAKAAVPHGEWDIWLRTHCTVSPRTAQAYMRLCTKLGGLPAEMRNAVADLPLREAMKTITTAPTAPPRASKSVRVPTRTDAERTAETLRAGAKAIQRTARDIEDSHRMNRREVEKTRAKLQAALGELDRLLAVTEPRVCV